MKLVYILHHHLTLLNFVGVFCSLSRIESRNYLTGFILNLSFTSVLVLSLVILLISCHQNKPDDSVYAQVNQVITEDFNTEDPQLWSFVEDEFYKSLIKTGSFQKAEFDTLEAVHQLNRYIGARGYDDNFLLDQEARPIQEII